MANTKSAKKNIRASSRKKSHNSTWKTKIKDVARSIKSNLFTKKIDDLTKQLTAFQKVADKAVKEKVIHKNKANRLKSKYARKIAALLSPKATKAAKAAKPTKPVSKRSAK